MLGEHSKFSKAVRAHSSAQQPIQAQRVSLRIPTSVSLTSCQVEQHLFTPNSAWEAADTTAGRAYSSPTHQPLQQAQQRTTTLSSHLPPSPADDSSLSSSLPTVRLDLFDSWMLRRICLSG